MWANSRAADGGGSLFSRIYEFRSADGIEWEQMDKPCIQPSGTIKSCVYPFVVRDGDRFVMWYGGHRDGGMFELFCATSKDGSTWNTNHEKPAFPGGAGQGAIRQPLHLNAVRRDDAEPVAGLYYSARDWNPRLYRRGRRQAARWIKPLLACGRGGDSARGLIRKRPRLAFVENGLAGSSLQAPFQAMRDGATVLAGKV